MLNKEGQTPLDVAIIETIAAADVKARKSREQKSKKDANMTSPQQILKENIEHEDAENEFEKETEKATMLIQRMQKYGPECSIKFV